MCRWSISQGAEREDDLKFVAKAVVGGTWLDFPSDNITVTTIGELQRRDLVLLMYVVLCRDANISWGTSILYHGACCTIDQYHIILS